MKLHLQLRHRKAVRDEERPEARLAAVFGQSVRMRCNHLRPAIPTPTFAIGAKPLTQFIARRTLRPQGRIGNCQPIGKRRTQQAILHRAPKRRHPHTVDALKCIRRLRTQQPAPTAQRRRAARLNKKTRAEQIIGHLQPPQKCRVVSPKRPIGMKLRKPLDGPQCPLRRRQQIPIMLKAEQMRLGLRDIIGPHMAPQPHELGIVVGYKQRTLLPCLREPREHPVSCQCVTSRMFMLADGTGHFHHHHIRQTNHCLCCPPHQTSHSVTGKRHLSLQMLQNEIIRQRSNPLSQSVTGRPCFDSQMLQIETNRQRPRPYSHSCS